MLLFGLPHIDISHIVKWNIELYPDNGISTMILNSTMNSTEGSSESIPLFNVVICVVNIPLSLVSIVANAVILVAILKTSALHSPSAILLSNLALTDLSVGLLAQPLFILNELVKWKASFASFYRISSDIYNVMGYCLCGASFFTVSAIGIDWSHLNII